MSRPLGEISARIVALAAREEVWSGKAAAELQLSRRQASVTVYNLALHGHLQEVDCRPVDGVARAVPIYRAPAPAPECSVIFLDWPREL
jgi:hypothetical protein